MPKAPLGQKSINYESEKVQVALRGQERRALSKRRLAVIRKWMELGRPDMVEKKLRLFAFLDNERTGRRTFEYICVVCNRPFTVPRKRNITWIPRCTICAEFIRKKREREYRASHRDKRVWPTRKPKPVSSEPPVRHTPPPARKVANEPLVVWQED